MSWINDPDFGEKVAKLCTEKYDSLPKTGKPQIGKEWTLLAGVVMCIQKETSYVLEIVSMATGSKCVGKSKMSKTGEILNDSHAEILARRAFLRFLYCELQKFYCCGGSTVLEKAVDNRCQFQKGITFHMYTSHTPCGDASIFPKGDVYTRIDTKDEADIGNVVVQEDTEHLDIKCNDIPIKTDTNDTNINSLKNLSDKIGNRTEIEKIHDTLKANNAENSEHTKCTEKLGGDRVGIDPVHLDDTSNYKVRLSRDQAGTVSIHQDETSVEHLEEARNDNKRNRENKELDGTENVIKQVKTDRNLDVHVHKCDSFNTVMEDAKEQSEKQSTEKNTKGNDIYRTGAKCVSYGIQDPLGDGDNYHITGAFRCPYSRNAIQRAIVDRNQAIDVQLPSGFRVNIPELYQSQRRFCHSKDAVMEQNIKCGRDIKLVPCSSAIAWCRVGVNDETLDVTTHGRKHGVTSKNLHKASARSLMSSKSLFDLFAVLKNEISPEIRPETLNNEDLKTYEDFKMAARPYQAAWQQLLRVYGSWERKGPGYLDFT